MPASDSKNEYKELGENMRQHSSMRFAQMTLFFALTAGLLSATFTSSPPLSSLLRFVLKTGGVITSIVFWIMEERVADYWHHYRRRAVELEKELGCKQYTTCPAKTIVTATNAVRALYACIFLFWIVALIWHSSF